VEAHTTVLGYATDTSGHEARCQNITHKSKNMREGIAAYLGRRAPRFSGC